MNHIVLDTDTQLDCSLCDWPIYVDEPKIVIGTEYGVLVLHPHCADYFSSRK